MWEKHSLCGGTLSCTILWVGKNTKDDMMFEWGHPALTEGYKQLVHAGDLMISATTRYSIKNIQADSQQKTAFYENCASGFLLDAFLWL